MNHLTAEQQALLILLQQSLWRKSLQLPSEVNWEGVSFVAKEQGVVSFLYDGIVAAKVDIPSDIHKKLKQKMLAGVMKNARLLSVQDELFTWFTQADIPVVVLKGSSIARYYPQPELRVLGDIDILVRKTDVHKATDVLLQHGCILQESDHAFHLGFSYSSAYIELHYDVTKAPDSAGGRATEAETARFLDHIVEESIAPHIFPALSEPDQALSLLLHMIRHMFNTGIGLRQLCDWAMYVASTDPDTLSNITIPLLARCGVLQYAKTATKTCVHYLGLPKEYASWCTEVPDLVCQAFIDNVFQGGNMGTANKDGLANLFTDRSAMGTEHSSLRALLSELTKLVYINFPFTLKYKFLLPLFWIFLPVRYLIRSAFGLRPKKSFIKVAQSAKQQRNLYELLNLFEIDA